MRATVRTVSTRRGLESLEQIPDPGELELNDIGRVTLRTSSLVLADPYRRNRTTGAFILIDEDSNETVGAGIVRSVREVKPAPRDGATSRGIARRSIARIAGARLGSSARPSG